jgi:hypothetical protein
MIHSMTKSGAVRGVDLATWWTSNVLRVSPCASYDPWPDNLLLNLRRFDWERVKSWLKTTSLTVSFNLILFVCVNYLHNYLISSTIWFVIFECPKRCLNICPRGSKVSWPCAQQAREEHHIHTYLHSHLERIKTKYNLCLIWMAVLEMAYTMVSTSVATCDKLARNKTTRVRRMSAFSYYIIVLTVPDCLRQAQKAS